MKISEEVIEKVISRAKIKVSQEQKGPLKKQITRILDYLTTVDNLSDNKEKVLQEVPHLEREDRVEDSNSEILLKRAPQREGTAFKVPLIIDGKAN